MAVGLPLQPLMEQSTGAYGANVAAPTIGSQRTVSFQPIKSSPVVASCVTLPTTLPREQTATSSQLRTWDYKRTVLISVVQGNKGPCTGNYFICITNCVTPYRDTKHVPT